MISGIFVRRETGFRSTPPRGGRHVKGQGPEAPTNGFDPRPREGGDGGVYELLAGGLGVSIHAPARGATFVAVVHHPHPRVSIHAPARGATPRPWCSGPWTWWFRSTPPRGGRLEAEPPRERTDRVSIHAPARGATDARPPSPRAGDVSIHAPARGATPRPPPPSWPIPSFDPRPREGGDRSRNQLVKPAGVFRSTPPRGGRPPSPPAARTLRRFDPRPREGGDTAGTSTVPRPPTFRSTPPRGGRRVSSARSAPILAFRSTPPRGGRRRATRRSEVRMKFRSTPPRGGRLAARLLTGDNARVSIHAPARGATSGCRAAACRSWCFDPRPREGGD